MKKVIPLFRHSMLALGMTIALAGCQDESVKTSVSHQPRAVAVDRIRNQSTIPKTDDHSAGQSQCLPRG